MLGCLIIVNIFISYSTNSPPPKILGCIAHVHTGTIKPALFLFTYPHKVYVATMYRCGFVILR